MNRKSMLTIGIAVWLAALGGLAISAQHKPDKYTVKVPGGLAFSEFRGYEGWQAISISRKEKVVAIILGNPVMIDAYQAGFPGNGKPVPDGAKMAKIHWMPKQNAFFPDTTGPGELVNVDFMMKDSKRFADSGGWGYGVFDYDAAADTFNNFPYSKKKDYVEWITEAKTDATREKRLATTIEWLAEGKSRHWKYQNC